MAPNRLKGQMPSKPLIAIIAAALVAPASAVAGVTMTAREIPLRPGRALGRRDTAAAVRHGRRALARLGHGALPHARPRGRVERLAAGRRRHRARSRQRGEPPARLAPRQSRVDGRVDCDPLPYARRRDASPCVLRREHRREARRPSADDRRRAVDHPALLVGRERGDPPCAAAVLRRRALRGRPSHRRLERVHAGRVGRDRARDRGLPRRRERLERHRLQLPRRQVRPGLRRAVRRSRPAGDRRARDGVQRRLGRRRPARRLQLDADQRGGPALPRAAAVVEARSLACRSAVDAQLAIDREPALPSRHAGVPAGRSPDIGTRTSPTAPEMRCTPSCRGSRRTCPGSACRSCTRRR